MLAITLIEQSQNFYVMSQVTFLFSIHVSLSRDQGRSRQSAAWYNPFYKSISLLLTSIGRVLLMTAPLQSRKRVLHQVLDSHSVISEKIKRCVYNTTT